MAFKLLQKGWSETLKDKWGKTPLSVFDELLHAHEIEVYQEFHVKSEGEKLPSGLERVSWCIITKDENVARYVINWDSKKQAPDDSLGYYTLKEIHTYSDKEKAELEDDHDYIFARLKLGLHLNKRQNQITQGSGKLFRHVDKWGNTGNDAVEEICNEKFGKGNYVWVVYSDEGSELPSGFEYFSFLVLSRDKMDKWQCFDLGWDSKKIAPDGSKGYYEFGGLGKTHEHDFDLNDPQAIRAKKELGLPVSQEQEQILKSFTEKQEKENWGMAHFQRNMIQELANVYGKTNDETMELLKEKEVLTSE